MATKENGIEYGYFLDDSTPMEPYPELSKEEKQKEEEFWSKLEDKYLKTDRAAKF